MIEQVPSTARFDAEGAAVVSGLVATEVREAAAREFDGLGARAGTRCALHRPAIAALAGAARVQELARAIVGPSAACERAILFAKGPEANWKVRWHQDTVIAVSRRFEEPGWGSWSVKEGQICVRAPARVLERRLAIRVDLDGSGVHNGGLRVIPGSHRFGVLEPAAARRLRDEMEEITPVVPAGGALVMRPLLLHASHVSESGAQRRVVHLEFGPAEDRR